MDTQHVATNADTAKFLTLPQAAGRSGVSVQTLRRRIKDGTIPAVLLASRYRIREDHLAEWIESGRAAA
jgi:excisionase family DNA binding protein